jgi:hypothetical protein
VGQAACNKIFFNRGAFLNWAVGTRVPKPSITGNTGQAKARAPAGPLLELNFLSLNQMVLPSAYRRA